LLEKLRGGLATLTDDELYIIEHLIYQEKTERELAKKLNITQQAISKKSKKILNKLKNFLEN
jgi:DNA-directed RNA polymerase specialized sigma subunit